jgi:ABC-type sugar transport system permease subunit
MAGARTLGKPRLEMAALRPGADRPGAGGLGALADRAGLFLPHARQHGRRRLGVSRPRLVSRLLPRDIFEPDLVTWNTRIWRSSGARSAVAFQTTVICAILGFPTAWFIATRPRTRGAIWLFLITIPFWTNLLIRTFAIQEVIRNRALINTLLIQAGRDRCADPDDVHRLRHPLGMAYVFLPLMVLPLYAAMDKLDFRLVEAGYDLYASRWQVLWHIVLPLVKPGFHRRLDPGLHPGDRRLCHAAGAGRRAQR